MASNLSHTEQKSKESNHQTNGQTRSEDAAGAARDYLLLASTLEVKATDDVPRPQMAWGQRYTDDDGNEHEIPLGEMGDFSAIAGKAKARKSFAIAIAVATALQGKNGKGVQIGNLISNIDEDKKVVVFDTEQKTHHVHSAAKRIAKMAGYENGHPDNLTVYKLRGLSPAECWGVISAVIESRDDIGLAVIDGIVDVIDGDGGITSREAAIKVVLQVMAWTEQKSMHIITVIHKNPEGEKLRGHIGTEVLNKAGSIINVEDNGDGTSTVKASASRGKAFEPFAFSIDDYGIPVEATQPKQLKKAPFTVKNITKEALAIIVREMFEVEASYTATEIKPAIAVHLEKAFPTLSAGKTNQEKLLQKMKSDGLIEARPGKGNRKYYYKVEKTIEQAFDEEMRKNGKK